jgi:hypothetical protein
MAVQIDATQPRTFGGQTARQIVEGFVTVQTQGARELAQALERAAQRAGKAATPLLEKAARDAALPIYEDYRNSVGDVTGNLRKSVKIRGSKKKYPGVGIAVVGPTFTGNTGATPEGGSGNHAWLKEFGTGRRRPGTQGRRTYINVHQTINGRMSRRTGNGQQAFNNLQFENMSRGNYFLMGSINEPTRQARQGSGYPHDFGYTNGRQHPITLGPGESIAPMPADHTMQKAIQKNSGQVLNNLLAALQRQIDQIRGSS